MAVKSKIHILAQEIIRRNMNTSRRATVGERTKIMDCFMVKLLNSGYSEEMRRTILEAGLNGYYKMVDKEVSSTLSSTDAPTPAGNRSNLPGTSTPGPGGLGQRWVQPTSGDGSCKGDQGGLVDRESQDAPHGSPQPM